MNKVCSCISFCFKPHLRPHIRPVPVQPEPVYDCHPLAPTPKDLQKGVKWRAGGDLEVAHIKRWHKGVAVGCEKTKLLVLGNLTANGRILLMWRCLRRVPAKFFGKLCHKISET